MILGLLGAKQFAKVVKTPKGFLLAGIGVLCVVGAFSASNNITDVYVMLIFGVAGYFLKICGFDISALVLGMMLGPIAEAGFMQAYTLNMNDLATTILTFFTRPLSLLLIAACIMSVLSPILKKRKAAKQAQ